MNKPKISELLLGYSKSDRHSLLRTLAASALLMALATICKAFLVLSVPMLGVEGQEINFGYTMIMFSGALFGPVWGGLVGLGADFLGFLLDNNGYAYSPGLAVTNIFVGCFSGIISVAFREKLKKLYVLIPFCFLTMTLASLNNSLWLTVIYGMVKKSFWAFSLPRLGFTVLVNFPLNTIILFTLMTKVEPILRKSGLLPKRLK